MLNPASWIGSYRYRDDGCATIDMLAVNNNIVFSEDRLQACVEGLTLTIG